MDGKFDVETKKMDLNSRTPQEIFEIFDVAMSMVENKENTIVRFYKNRFFMIQEGKKKITYFCINKHDRNNFKMIKDTIFEFCIKNDVEFILV